MNKIQVLFFSALALPLSIGTARAIPNPDELPQVSCSAMRFSHAFLAKYPKAPAACQDVRVYKGERYAKFDAKVYIADPAFTTVQLLNVAGDPVTTFSLKPGPDEHVLVNGDETAFHDLKVGQKVTFWVSEKRLEAVELPGSTEHAWTVLPPTSK
jgi:hypothetical protein